ncbi:ACP S-malonyltransferase [Bacillus cereus group sp. N34]|uniref:ACP S-malonyltransferase n=1 Tax=Bacillus cereus group sp. N34 TaxID=2794595 RepID=UPI0018F31ABE|nr:ACP S-malonyltransferase [Bacillus cereus group sp. N34]MBJ8015082.1 ACP S-malonyltransferase [Bacillus cereus group sp. N34]
MEKFAFVFPGQGSQYIGMGKSLYNQYSIVKQTFEEASEILKFDLRKLCIEGNLSDLSNPEHLQPALLTVSVATYRAFMKEIGISPDLSAGHSLGEYAALTCSGTIRFSDAIRIVKLRGKYTQQIINNCNGAMTIIDGIDYKNIENECNRISTLDFPVSVSCFNLENQVAISGHEDAVIRMENYAQELGGTTTPLFMSAPFHSILMQPIADLLQKELLGYKLYPTKWPVISNVNATPYISYESVPQLLSSQITKPVQWLNTMKYFQLQGITKVIEMGPKNVLSAMVKQSIPEIDVFSYDQKEDRKALLDYFNENSFLKKHSPTFIDSCLAIAVSTPNQNWDADTYQQKVVKSYNQLKDIKQRLEQQGVTPDYEQMNKALEILKGILINKEVPLMEQQECLHRLIDETGAYYLFPELIGG